VAQAYLVEIQTLQESLVDQESGPPARRPRRAADEANPANERLCSGGGVAEDAKPGSKTEVGGPFSGAGSEKKWPPREGRPKLKGLE
jgi:hypothetical protein